MRNVRHYLAVTAVAAALIFPAAASEWNWADETSDASSGYAASKAICHRLRDLRPPQEHYPAPTTAKTLEGCDSEALYYGFGMDADPVRARQCALLEIGEYGDKLGAAFRGRGILMVVYANGVGAQRNLDLATALACRLHEAPSGVDARVRHLQRLKSEGWRGQDFNFCDDFGSTQWGVMCVDHRAREQDDRRMQRLARLSEEWNDERRAAFQPLLSAMRAFANVSSHNEVDLSGSGRWGFVIEHEQQLRDAFLAVLEMLESQSLPSATAEEYQEADARLNAVYRQVMAMEVDPEPGLPYQTAESLPGMTMTQSGIREAQRAWLPYRDAWLAFATEHYRHIGDSLGAWLTRQRTDDLKRYLPDPQPPRPSVADPARRGS
jgi:uncharacterized protein YecT (DUF1311 family)